MRMRIIFGIALMAAATLAMAQDRVEVRRAGTLSSLLTERQKENCTSLAVSGKLNSADIRVLRQMAGYTDEGGKGGKLEYIDLKEAEFVSDKTPFMTLDAAAEHLAGTALPGKVKDREEVVGIPLQRQHQKDYSVYRDKFWRSPSYFDVSSVMYMKGKSVLYYRPKYYLGHDGKEGITLNSDVQVSSDVRFRETGQRQPSEQWMNRGEFLFADGTDKGQLRKMRRYRIKRFAGHRIYLGEDGRCKMSVGTHRGRFFHDTFYKCPALQSVVLPKGMDVDYTVEDATSGVNYLLPEPEVEIVYIPEKRGRDRRVFPSNLGHTGLDKSVLLKGEAATGEIITALAGLSPAGEKRRERDLDVHVRITVTDRDISKRKTYYIDKDRQYIYAGNDGEGYAMPSGLTGILKSLGVYR